MYTIELTREQIDFIVRSLNYSKDRLSSVPVEDKPYAERKAEEARIDAMLVKFRAAVKAG